MPLYEYKCECGKILDQVQLMMDPKLKSCKELDLDPKCDQDKKIKRLISRSEFQIINRSTMTDRKLYKELDIE